MIPVALLGASALLLTYLWLGSAIAASLLSERKGYGEKPGLACGLLLSVLGLLIWLAIPAREDSKWKKDGILPKRRKAFRNRSR
ncbi:MAG: hypothetical protein ACSLFD_07060 [Solirubrobacterales bacterium]